MTRTAAIITVGLLCCGIECWAGEVQGRSGGTEDSTDVTARPNIIVILADDLGYGDLGVNGSTMISTPNLDRLAAEGVRLTSFYAAANVCTPSRAGLLTGRYPIRMGLAVKVIVPSDTHGLPPEEMTLPEILRDRGYRTAMAGKWHLGHQPEFWPTENGFDSFLGVLYSNDMKPFALYRGRENIEEPADQATLTERYTAAAVETIEGAGDRPFFFYLAHTFPHRPLHVSDRFRGRSEAALYGDVVETIDWSVGEILAALERTGKARDTLILFTSDNGPWFEGSTAGYRDRKGGTWEGSYRVPLIAWWPGMLPSGAAVDEPATALDVLPTLARVSGAHIPATVALDGIDIWPTLAHGAPSTHDQILFFDNDQISGVRKGKWSLVVRDYYRTLNIGLYRFGYPLLFDLERDPAQSYNLARDEPEILDDLLQRIEAAKRELGVPPPPPVKRSD
jgi:uncharacterized sulfatase